MPSISQRHQPAAPGLPGPERSTLVIGTASHVAAPVFVAPQVAGPLLAVIRAAQPAVGDPPCGRCVVARLAGSVSLPPEAGTDPAVHGAPVR
jgi:hypothetical protein